MRLIVSHLKFLHLFCLAICLWVASFSAVLADLEGTVTQGQIQPVTIAIPTFHYQGGQEGVNGAALGNDIVKIIQADLARSGLFIPLNPASFLQKDLKISDVPKFGDWRIIRAQALVIGQLTHLPNGYIQAQFRLWDPYTGKQLVGTEFSAAPSNWRRIAHMIADSIYQRLTGEKPYFDTQIAFVDETGPKNKRVKRLAIMDQDTANMRYLTNGRYLVLTPRFHPKRHMLTYMSYETGIPRVYLFDLTTGQKRVVGDFPNMSFAPRFSPDGSKIIMSLQKGGAANIFTLDLATRQLRALTGGPSIDTAPSFSPDGGRIVFETDRTGSQQLYVMNADGSNPQQISRGTGRYSTPVWSPRGDLIAFTKQMPGRFLIGVMRPDGTGERILTEGYHNEGPSWAPNGRVLTFFRDIPGGNGGAQLYTVDLTGHNEQRLRTPSWGSDPAWSPLISGQ